MLTAVLALMLASWGQTAGAMDLFDIPDGVTASADAGEGLDVFQSFEVVRDVMDAGTVFDIPLSWIPGAEDFGIEAGQIIVEPDEHRISIVAQPDPGSKFDSGFWLMLDWDDGTIDLEPELTAGFRVDNLPLADLNPLFDLGADVPISLQRGWVLFSSAAASDTIITFTVDELPNAVLAFLGNGSPNAAISSETPLELGPGANFVAELNITQNTPLKQTFALAGVTGIDLVLRGTLAADASSLFGAGDAASLLDFHMTATLDATGASPPAWLEDRSVELEFGFDDADDRPFIGIGDTVTTFVGEASNTFRRGTRFDPDFFTGRDTSIPLLMKFDLVGNLEEPFEIDLAGLLGTEVDNITVGFEIGATLDLTTDDPVTSVDIGFKFTFGATTIAMTIDTEPSGAAFATFSLTDPGTVSQLVDRLAAVFGVPSPDLDPIGQLGVPNVTVTVKKVGALNTVRLVGTVSGYDNVFGLEWLDLESLALDVTLSNKTQDEGEDIPSIFGSLTAEAILAGEPWTAVISVGGTLQDDTASIEGKVTLSLRDGGNIGIGPVFGMFADQFSGLPAIPDELDALSLRDIELALVAKRSGAAFEIAFDAFAVTTIPVLEMDAAMYVRAGFATNATGDTELIFDLGLRPLTAVKLSELLAVPGLSDNPETSPELPAFALVVTTGTTKTPLNQLTKGGFDFYKGLYGCEQDATVCPQSLDLEPGVNMIANLAAFPEAIDPLISALWMDPDQGLQFIGRIPFFGVGGDTGVDLQIRLPEIAPPPQVDFLTGGRLAIGVSAGPEGLRTYLQGRLQTRWRRSEANPGTCVGIGGVLQTGLDPITDTTFEENEYCYDVLNFELEAALSLSTSGVTASLTGSVIATEGFGWEEPFGIPGITIRSLTLAIQLGFEPPSSLSFVGGFAGDIIIGDPENGGKQFSGSAGLGFSIIPAPTPAGVTVVPKFVGVRGYVSSIGMTDVARLWEILFPEAPGLDELAGLPLAELRNAEFMLALEDNPQLCFTAGVFLAGELYIYDELPPPAPVIVPPTNEAGCAPFGALVDPDTCLSDDPTTGRRADGCFATFFGQLSLSGIVADGRIGALDLGPIHFDDSQLTFKLTPAEQVLIIRGGMHIVDPSILSGELALRVGLTELDFYGKVVAFGFDAEVEGGVVLGLEPPFVPTFDASLHVALGTDFDAAFRNAADPALRAFSDSVATTFVVYEGLKATDGDPFETLRRLPADLDAVGVSVPLWYDNPDPLAIDALGALNTIADLMATANVESPTMGQLFAGIDFAEPFTIAGVEFAGTCYAAPFTDGVVVDDVCYSVYIAGIPGIGDLVPGAPTSFTAFLQDVVEPALSDALHAVGLPADVEFADLGDELIARLQGLGVPVELTCADFDFDTASESPNVSLHLAGQIFGSPFGVDVGWDFDAPIEGQATALAEDLISQLFGQPATSACEPIDVSDNPLGESLADMSFEPATTPGTITEGGSVTLAGTYAEGLIDADAAVIDWGDGSTAETTTIGALRTGVDHTYVDDDPTGTSADTKLIGVTISDVTKQVSVRVVNRAPAGLTLDGPARVNEADPLTVTGTFTDIGLADTFAVAVTWGDGSASSPTATAVAGSAGMWTFEATHAYDDDNPSHTSADNYTIRAVVTDDDTGSTSTQKLVTVDDVAPSNAAIVALVAAGETIDEGVEVTFRISWDDPGNDSFTVIVDDFGDGTGGIAFASGRSVEISHIYRDDDPTATPVDSMTIKVRVVDDDLLTGTGETTVDVHNVDPIVDAADSAGSDTISVQYSDPIGGWIAPDGTYGIDPMTVTAYDVTPDTDDPGLSLSATIVEQGSGDTPAALPDWLHLGTPTCTPDPASSFHSTCSWELSADVPGAGPYIHTNLPVGTYEIVFTATDDDTGTGSATLTIEVLPEDAQTWYVGPTFAATDSANDGDVNVELRSTVRDISSVPDDPLSDPWPGDIRTANVTFVDRDVDSDSAFPCERADDPPVEVDEVFDPFDVFVDARNIGVGTCDWLATVVEADPYTVGTLVGGNYASNRSTDDAVVTVARPLDEFITGGGYLVLSDSAGSFAGEVGTHANYGFNVKFNKKGTNLRGRATIVFRIGDHTYQIKSTATNSLGVYDGQPADDSMHAEFEAKATLTDVTDPDNPVSLGGNLVLQMRMTDASEDGLTDTIAFTLWDTRREGNGNKATYAQLLEFSSNWDGNESQEQTIGGGNILVHD